MDNMDNTEFFHIPVLLNEVIGLLDIKTNGTYLDCTMGAGGHSAAILQRLGDGGKLVSIDRDINAINHCKYTLAQYADKHTIVKDNYKNACQVLDDLGIDKIDGVLLDLGISSPQIDMGYRGFSYMHDGPLDMRMDTEQKLTAFDVVNNYGLDKLTFILREYGEEQFSRRIAQAIVAQREFGQINTTFDLVDIIDSAVPAAYRHKGHTAKKTFQAIRIEVNSEISGLAEFCDGIIDRLNEGGRMVVVAFHSLEDKVIKDCFRENATDCICPKDFPICICSHRAKVKIITKKPMEAATEELARNPRAASAKLRCAQKI